MHLITDEGFTRRLLANLLLLSLLTAICTANRHLRNILLDAYYATKEYAMQIANEMAWWSLLGLLSSSCCAVQILLNAFSFGCAGFNTALGPTRPTFIAVTILLQCSSWYAAYTSIVRNEHQLKMTVGSTVLSACLTLLPEVLAWQTVRREGCAQNRQSRQSQLNNETISKERDSLSNNGNDEKSGRILQLQFKLSTMGCASCVSAVSKVLDGIDGVLRHTVTLADGTAEITLDECEATLARESRDEKTIVGADDAGNVESIRDSSRWRDVATRLELAGFPADDVTWGRVDEKER